MLTDNLPSPFHAFFSPLNSNLKENVCQRYLGTWRLEENAGCPGAEVTDGGEPSDVGSVKRTEAHTGTASALNH